MSVKSSIAAALEHLESNRIEEAWSALRPHWQLLASDERLAETWIRVATAGVPLEEWREAALELAHGRQSDWQFLQAIGWRIHEAAERLPMDEPPATKGLSSLAAALAALALKAYPATDDAVLASLHGNLGNALRLTGTGALEAEEHLKTAIEREPDPEEQHHRWFNLGLLYKWQGRWAEGLRAAQKRLELGDRCEGALWNAGICATGLGDGATALALWKQLGLKLELGQDGLPVGGFRDVQVRLSSLGPGTDARAHQPDAIRHYEDVWVERLSPCHGRITSATVFDMPADFDDLVLWDGAPVDYRLSDGNRVPRFPLLSIIRPSRARLFRFVASQHTSRFWQDLKELPPGVAFYVHSEQVIWQCSQCAKGDQSHADDHSPECDVVSGKLIVPRELPMGELERSLDRVRHEHDVELALPGLYPDGSRERQEADQIWARLEERLPWQPG